MDKRQSAAEIEETAVRWVWRLDREGRTPQLIAELDRWLGQDARHRGAMLQAEATWMMLDRGSQLPANDAGPVESADAPPKRHWFSRRHAFGGLGMLAAAAASLLLVLQPDARYDTGVGEIRRVQLIDGSSVMINTSSAVDFDDGTKRRLARLSEGEAWFKVAKNRARPFVVEAGAVRVQAVGTAFSVRRRANGADVLVTEGVVETWVAGADGHRVRVAAGERAFVADNAAISARPAAVTEIDRALAWRTGKIDLNGETLGWAAAEFNRYNRRGHIEVAPSIAGERLFGVFRIDDPGGFVAAVELSLGAKAARDAEGTIVLSAGK
jgi:transmembrane sensor